MKALFFVVSLLVFVMPAWAQFVAPGAAVPVVANNPGLNGTFWRSDVSILNTSDTDTTVSLYLFPEIIGGEGEFEPIYLPDARTVPANSQITITNIVQSEFGLFDHKGGLSVLSTTGAPLVVTSRVYTFGDEQCDGSYGQNVESVLVRDEAWAAGLQHNASYRTNLGIFMNMTPPIGSAVDYLVEVFTKDGVLAGTDTVQFNEAGLQQLSLDSFGVENLMDGYAVISCASCNQTSILWYGYVSIVDETSGDAVFRVAKGRQLAK